MISILGQEFLLVRVGGGYAIHLKATIGNAQNTLCGRDAADSTQPDATPSCRQCLAVVDELFPQPSLDPRSDLIASMVVEALVEEGVAEVTGVPGDQMAGLRRSVRKAISSRLGYRARTYVLGDRLIVHCQQAYERHADRRLAEAAQAMSALSQEGASAPIDDTGWRIHWSAWELQ